MFECGFLTVVKTSAWLGFITEKQVKNVINGTGRYRER